MIAKTNEMSTDVDRINMELAAAVASSDGAAKAAALRRAKEAAAALKKQALAEEQKAARAQEKAAKAHREYEGLVESILAFLEMASMKGAASSGSMGSDSVSARNQRARARDAPRNAADDSSVNSSDDSLASSGTVSDSRNDAAVGVSGSSEAERRLAEAERGMQHRSITGAEASTKAMTSNSSSVASNNRITVVPGSQDSASVINSLIGANLQGANVHINLNYGAVNNDNRMYDNRMFDNSVSDNRAYTNNAYHNITAAPSAAAASNGMSNQLDNLRIGED